MSVQSSTVKFTGDHEVTSTCIPASIITLRSDRMRPRSLHSRAVFEAGSKLLSIDEHTFGHSWRLLSICIPSSVRRLLSFCFRYCESLSSSHSNVIHSSSALTGLRFWRFPDAILSNPFISLRFSKAFQPSVLRSVSVSGVSRWGLSLAFRLLKRHHSRIAHPSPQFAFLTLSGHCTKGVSHIDEISRLRRSKLALGSRAWNTLPLHTVQRLRRCPFQRLSSGSNHSVSILAIPFRW
jgi:hypothetical protein